MHLLSHKHLAAVINFHKLKRNNNRNWDFRVNYKKQTNKKKTIINQMLDIGAFDVIATLVFLNKPEEKIIFFY